MNSSFKFLMISERLFLRFVISFSDFSMRFSESSIFSLSLKVWKLKRNVNLLGLAWQLYWPFQLFFRKLLATLSCCAPTLGPLCSPACHWPDFVVFDWLLSTSSVLFRWCLAKTAMSSDQFRLSTCRQCFICHSLNYFVLTAKNQVSHHLSYQVWEDLSQCLAFYSFKIFIDWIYQISERQVAF